MSALDWIDATESLDPAFCVRFSQTLLHFLWQGAAVGVLVLVAGWCLRRAAAGVRYAINLAAMLLMVACLPVTFALIPASGTQTRASRAAAEPARVVAVEPPGVSFVEPTPELGFPPGEPFTAEPPSIEDDIAVLPTVEAEQTQTEVVGSPLRTVASYATAAYLLGVVVMLVRLGVALWGGHRLKRCATPVDDRSSLAWIAEQARRLGMKAAPAVAYCRRVAVPVVVGIVKPVILLPTTLATGLATDQLEAIFTHELAHIRRFDLLANLLQRLAESLLFFHPAVWYVSRRVSIEREDCCDDFVVSSGCGRLQYAGALLRVAELCGRLRGSEVAGQPATLAAGERPSQFKRRVMRLLGVEPRVRLNRSGTAAVLLLLAVLVAAPVAVHIWMNRAVAHDVAEPLEEQNEGPSAAPTDEMVDPFIEDQPDHSEQSAKDEPAVERASKAAAGVIDVRVVDSNGNPPLPVVLSAWEPLSSSEAGRTKRFDYPPWLYPSVVDDLRVWRDPGGPYWRHVGTYVGYGDLYSDQRGTRPCETQFSMYRPGKYRIMAHLLSGSPAERDEEGRAIDPSHPRRYLFVDATSEPIALELSEKVSVTLVVPDKEPARAITPRLQRVRVRITGGEEKTPIEGLVVMAFDMNLVRDKLIAQSTTDADGMAVFQLPASRYKWRFHADRELPYVTRWLTSVVREEPGEQDVDINLYEACELVLRAVDVDTGRGIPGVKFGLENEGYEYWMQLFASNNLGAKRDSSESAYETDVDGYYRCLLLCYPSTFDFDVYSAPPGYATAGGQQVSLKLTAGGRVEHTFKLRRRVNADIKEGTGSAEAAPAAVEPIDPEHMATAEEFLRYFKEGRIKEARRLMNTWCAGSELERIQASFHERAGPFQEVLSYRNRRILDRTVLEARCRWERAVMLIRLLFDEDGEIDGFWLARDPQGPTPEGFRKGGYHYGGRELRRIARPLGVIEVQVVDSHGKPPPPLIVTAWESLSADAADALEQAHAPPWLFPGKTYYEPWVWRDPKTGRCWRRAGDYVGRGEWWGDERARHPCEVSFTRYKPGDYLIMAHLFPSSPAERDREGRTIDPRRPRYCLHVDAKSQVIPLELSRRVSVRLVVADEEHASSGEREPTTFASVDSGDVAGPSVTIRDTDVR